MKTTNRINHLLGAVLSLLVTFGLTHSAAAQSTARIAFQERVTVKTPKPVTSYQIFSMNSDGTGVAQLTSASAGALNPSWSPGQQYIAFWRQSTLYVMEAIGEANGGRIFPVAPAGNFGSDWSPDGSRICFLGTSAVGYGLWIVDVNAATGGVGTPILVRAGECFWPAWSPNGTRIAFCSDDGGATQQVVKVRDLATGAEISFGVGPTDFLNFNPRWSPDGTRIAFSGPVTFTTTSRNGTQTTSTGNEIFIANADGTGITQVTSLKSFTTFPAWSPDGTALAFRSDFNGTAAIYKMALGSSVVTLLRSGANAPDWAP